MRDKDLNWSVSFEITIDGVEQSFDELDSVTQDYILAEIADGSFSGTTAGAGFAEDEEHDYNDDDDDNTNDDF